MSNTTTTGSGRCDTPYECEYNNNIMEELIDYMSYTGAGQSADNVMVLQVIVELVTDTFHGNALGISSKLR